MIIIISWIQDIILSRFELKYLVFQIIHLQQSKNIVIGSWWFDNWRSLEEAHLWSILHEKHWDHRGKHIFLRYKKFVSEDEIASLSREAYMTLSIQGNPQVTGGYVPCRLLKNMSYSVLGISNNLFMANLFDEDEVIIDRDIFTLLNKAEKVFKEFYKDKAKDHTYNITI